MPTNNQEKEDHSVKWGTFAFRPQHHVKKCDLCSCGLGHRAHRLLSEFVSLEATDGQNSSDLVSFSATNMLKRIDSLLFVSS